MNDNVIEFALYDSLETTSNEVFQKMELFSTQFYTRLISRSKLRGSCFDATESEINHINVCRWTKDTNIFDGKKILLFPINEENFHWYLILVVLPDVSCGVAPYIAVLDSMGGNRDSVAEHIRNYLLEELKCKKMTTTFMEKALSKMEIIYPRIPQQPDGSSCGVYLVHYVKQLVKGVENNLLSKVFDDTTSWSNEDELRRLRFEIAQLIIKTAKNQGIVFNVPDIQLFPTVAEDKAEKRKLTNKKDTNVAVKKNMDGTQTKVYQSYANYISSVKSRQKDIVLRRKYDF